MISVLIPIFNRNVTELINEVRSQFIKSKTRFEIICFEDGSSIDSIEENEGIKDFENITYHISEKNLGRIRSRQRLSEMAKYPWLLFLDADVKIQNKDFIQKYIESTNRDAEVVFGGFSYYPEAPTSKFLLRWKYGRANEQVLAKTRNTKPYKIVISANYLIKKEIFDKVYGRIEFTGYGYDNFFGALLKDNNIKVLHIDNNVYHLGIEESAIYLEKKEKAAEALIKLYLSEKINVHENDLLKLFIHLKSLGLHTLLGKLFLNQRHRLRSNLLGNNPSIQVLQLYRIGYMCYYESLI